MPELALFNEQPVAAIVGREPSWIIKSGISLIFIIFTALLLLTWFIQYPDTIYSKITLTTSQPPAKLVSQVDGKIIELYVNNNERVSRGQSLLLIESSVDYKNLKKLENNLSTLKKSLDTSQFHNLEMLDLNIVNLGELQPAVNHLVSKLNDLSIHINSQQLSTRMINAEILTKQYRKLQQKLLNKKLTWEKKLALESLFLKKQKELSKKGLISAYEILPIENSFLDKKLALKDIDIQFELYEIKLHDLTQSLAVYRLTNEEKKQQLKYSVFNRYSELTSQISYWKQKYFFVAPTDGIVSFSRFWSINQHVNRGDITLTIANPNKAIIGKTLLNQIGMGKIKPGQRVDIELESYPSVEYGQLEGRVKNISFVPGKKGYMMDVSLPQKLTTSYGKNIPFSPNLIGKAKIVTTKKRLFERFFNNILYVLDNTK
jgi:multidrug resistance efflux pump